MIFFLINLSLTSPDVYFSTARICSHRNLRFEVLWNRLKEVEAKLSLAEAAEADVRSILADKYNLMRQLFDTVWTMRNDKDICGMLVEKINQSGAPEMARYLISAITLSLLEYFDRDKFVSLYRYLRECCITRNIGVFACRNSACLAQIPEKE